LEQGSEKTLQKHSSLQLLREAQIAEIPDASLHSADVTVANEDGSNPLDDAVELHHDRQPFARLKPVQRVEIRIAPHRQNEIRFHRDSREQLAARRVVIRQSWTDNGASHGGEIDDGGHSAPMPCPRRLLR
jgi:hypothetical protein